MIHSPRRGEDGKIHLTEKQEAFIDFLLTPPDQRECSQNEWARRNDMNQRTLVKWKKEDPFFRERWREEASKRNVSPEAVQPIIEVLRQRALTGDTKAAELYLKYVAQIAPPQVLQVEHKSAAELTDEELEKAARGFLHVVEDEAAS